MMEATDISESFLRSIDVHNILPQQEPFVMIGALTHFEMNATTTETEIKATNIFVDHGKFSASGVMENIAQTCAAREGFYNKYILHKDVQMGYIGAIRDCQIQTLPPVGATITTRIDILEEVFGMTLARAMVTFMQGDDRVVVATAEMKLAVRENE